ncbi:MAG: beta-ketoacyl-ACP reductase [Desulfomonilaceae bacterium]
MGCWKEILSLRNKTALVTGAGRGLGRAIAVALGEHGAFVNVNYHASHESAVETLSLIREAGGDGRLAPFDVASAEQAGRGVTDILEACGGIDILVNNAGVRRDGLVGRMKDEDWESVVATNLSGAFYLSRAVAKTMIRKRWGRIINISSTAGEAGNAGQANYSAAKAGLIGLTKSLARELAPRNILVNAVAPGIIEGGMLETLGREQVEAIRSVVPLGRAGRPNDVAAAVLFLCSGMADYITGQVIRVNGGLYM